MAIEFLTKQGYDAFVLTANFSRNMSDSDAVILSNSIVSAIDKNKADVSESILTQGDKAASGHRLQIRVKAGTQALSPFIVTFQTGATTLGNQFEKDIKVKIKEIPNV